MIKICPGWTTRHEPEVVLEPEDGIDQVGKVSHGMCPACKAALDLELDKREKQK